MEVRHRLPAHDGRRQPLNTVEIESLMDVELKPITTKPRSRGVVASVALVPCLPSVSSWR